MKIRSRLSYLGIFALFMVGLNSTYADNVCSDSPDAVHCAGMAGGVPDDTGGYLQLEWVNSLQPPVTVCANNTLGISLEGDDIQKAIKAGIIKGLSPKNPVNITWKFWQCSDASCTKKQLLSVDVFKLFEFNDQQNFTAVPKIYNIPSLKSKEGVSCVPPAVPRQDILKKLLAHKSS